jgi:hypothetical protein
MFRVKDGRDKRKRMIARYAVLEIVGTDPAAVQDNCILLTNIARFLLVS